MLVSGKGILNGSFERQ